MSNKYYIIPIFVPHRGCPHDCVFCNQKKITGSLKDITYEDVVETINTYLDTIDRENSYIEVSFFGGSFTGIPMKYQNRLLKAAKEAYDEGKIHAIRLSTRPDYIDRDILDNLKRYSVGVIELGVQSMDDEVLIASERGHSPKDVMEAAKLIKEYGFKLGLQMMVGLPKDNQNKDIYTAEELIKLKPDFVRIYPALVIKDTYMEQMYQNGEYKPLTVDEAVEICKEAYKRFTRNGIKIIRIGLQPTEQINLGRDVVAGPFHPAIRELVESSLLNDMMGYCIEKFFSDSKEITVNVSPKDISRLYADKKRIFYNKKSMFTSKVIHIRQNSCLNSMQLLLENDENKKTMSIIEYINITC